MAIRCGVSTTSHGSENLLLNVRQYIYACEIDTINEYQNGLIGYAKPI